MIVIQRIETSWTKISRGMPKAATRNAVPRVMEVPLTSPLKGELYVHAVKAKEQDNFALSEEVFVSDELEYRDLAFVKREDYIEVLFTYNYYSHGKPNRGGRRRTLFNLREEEMGAFHINGRITTYSGQSYVQHSIHIGNYASFEEDAFTGREPTVVVDRLVNLF
jgi:hypothetical protein